MRLLLPCFLLGWLPLVALAAPTDPERNPFLPPVQGNPGPTKPAKPGSPGPVLPLPPPLPTGWPALPLPPLGGAGSETKADSVRKPSARAELETARARCVVTLKSAPMVQLPAGGGTTRLRLDIKGGRGCVKGVLSEESWLQVGDLSPDGEAEVTAGSNDGAAARTGVVAIANIGQAITVQVRQPAPPAAEYVGLDGRPRPP